MESLISQIQRFEQNPATYLAPPRRKENYARTYELLAELKAESVLDLGCASGDFLYFLPEGLRGTGVDKSKILIAEARKRCPRHRFVLANILLGNHQVFREHFDAVVMLGFLSTFVDFRPILDFALNLDVSTLIINSPFNPEPVDAVHFSKSLLDGEDDYQCAYSIPSIKSVSDHLQQAKITDFSFTPSQMRTELVPDPNAPIRNYHLRLENGERLLTNGIGLLLHEYFLVIHR